ncbi:unnamed protein product, partial [Amoebophrya sp. A25]
WRHDSNFKRAILVRFFPWATELVVDMMCPLLKSDGEEFLSLCLERNEMAWYWCREMTSTTLRSTSTLRNQRQYVFEAVKRCEPAFWSLPHEWRVSSELALWYVQHHPEGRGPQYLAAYIKVSWKVGC